MQEKFAKAIAANIRDIAINTARLEYEKVGAGHLECTRAIDVATARIAGLLQQPGSGFVNSAGVTEAARELTKAVAAVAREAVGGAQ